MSLKKVFEEWLLVKVYVNRFAKREIFMGLRKKNNKLINATFYQNPIEANNHSSDGESNKEHHSCGRF